MALQLSRREVDDLRSSLDRAIYRTIGKSDSSLLSTVASCLTNGYSNLNFIMSNLKSIILYRLRQNTSKSWHSSFNLVIYNNINSIFNTRLTDKP